MVTTNEVLKILDHPQTLENIANGRVINRDAFIKEIMYATQIVAANTIFANVNAKTVFQCCLNAELSGLTLNPVLGLAYLVPFDGQCKLMPSYKGLAHLVFEAGNVKAITTQIIHQNDDFVIDLADSVNPVSHKVTFGNRGQAIGVYSIATFPNGQKQVEIMEKADIELIRASSQDYTRRKQKGTEKDSVWVKHESEMWRKTVIKRLCKYLPKSLSKQERLQRAIELDNDVADYDLPVSLVDCLNADEMLRKATMLSEGEYINARLELDSIKTKSQYRVFKERIVQYIPPDINQQLLQRIENDK